MRRSARRDAALSLNSAGCARRGRQARLPQFCHELSSIFPHSLRAASHGDLAQRKDRGGLRCRTSRHTFADRDAALAAAPSPHQLRLPGGRGAHLRGDRLRLAVPGQVTDGRTQEKDDSLRTRGGPALGRQPQPHRPQPDLARRRRDGARPPVTPGGEAAAATPQGEVADGDAGGRTAGRTRARPVPRPGQPRAEPHPSRGRPSPRAPAQGAALVLDLHGALRRHLPVSQRRRVRDARRGSPRPFRPAGWPTTSFRCSSTARSCPCKSRWPAAAA